MGVRHAVGVILGALAVVAIVLVVRARSSSSSPPVAMPGATSCTGVGVSPCSVVHDNTPIKHIVVIDQENHSFDNVLGPFCVYEHRCDGALTGVTATGQRVPLRRAPDVVAAVSHSTKSQRIAIDGGRMDGFSRMFDCTQLQCYVAYRPKQIPNLTRLARHFALNDMTFETTAIPSFGSHLELVAAGTDGFTGDNPVRGRARPGPGWGCDSRRDAPWRSSPSAAPVLVPACVPQKDGDGPYRPSPVQWVPTILDRFQGAGVSWALYSETRGNGYGWAICPTFADCLLTPEHRRLRSVQHFVRDARTGRLPSFAIVTPTQADSQHNRDSMREGDDWIGRAVAAVEHGPDWRSTAIFITYDDCGCFYDHVPPPNRGSGIRVPMVIVSPYARPRFTDSRPATLLGLLAFAEKTLGVAPLSTADATAYDFSNAFDYHQRPVSRVPMVNLPVPQAELRYLAAHPPSLSDTT
ncbi:MAG: alkaline phosphatase family protein [Gaiellales bacterium]